MSKRFTDTCKWEDPWFMDLSKDAKLVWLLLWDRCDNAGVVAINRPLFGCMLGVQVDWPSVLAEFGSRISTNAAGLVALRDYLPLQYPNGLDERSNPQRQVLRLIDMHGLERSASGTVLFPNVVIPIHGKPPWSLQDTDTALDKDKDKDQDTARARAADERQSQDITSPDSPASTNDGHIDPEHRWIYERGLPWARTIKAHLGAINQKNWELFKGLWDRFGEAFVVDMLKRHAGKYKWAEEFVTLCVDTHALEYAPVVEPYHSEFDQQVDREHEQIRGIFARLGGWHRVLTALGMPLADRDPSDNRWLWETIMPGNGSLREELLALADKPDLTHLANAVPSGVLATIGADPTLDTERK